MEFYVDFCFVCCCCCLYFSEIIKHSKDVAQQQKVFFLYIYQTQQQSSSHVLSIKIILCVWLFCNCILCRFQHSYLLCWFCCCCCHLLAAGLKLKSNETCKYFCYLISGTEQNKKAIKNTHQ